MVNETVSNILDDKFFRYLVLIRELSFNGICLILNVLCVEDNGTKDVEYKLEFIGVKSFEFWRREDLDRGFEVDVDDITLSTSNNNSYYSIINFDCAGFVIIAAFTEIIKTKKL